MITFNIHVLAYLYKQLKQRLAIHISVCLKWQYFFISLTSLIFIWSFVFPPAASVLLCVRVVCLRGVFAVRASSTMRRGKKEEEATSDGENDTATSTAPCIQNYIRYTVLLAVKLNSWELYSLFLTKQFCSLTAPPKKAKKTKEPEAPILYEDPPDKMTSKDGRDANMKITSWNVDGLRAWVKKKGLDVSFTWTRSTKL